MTNENLTPPSSPNRGRGHLSASTLKIIACIFMTVDHVGVHILPHVGILRVLGRVAFPIFAYFIAEGCRYTRNKPKRLLLMSLFGVLFEAAYFLYDGYVKGDLLAGGFEGNIFLTFSLSILLIYCVQAIKRGLAARSVPRVLLSCGAFALSLLLARAVHILVDGISYGMAGILLPVLISLVDYKEGEAPSFLKRLDCRPVKLLLCAVGCVLVSLCAQVPLVQIFCLLALVPLALYNGKPGRRGLKYGFYVYYPAHILVILLLDYLLTLLSVL